MPAELNHPSASQYPLGIRHSGDRRVNGDRRKQERGALDRRRRMRRRQRLRSLIFSALAVAVPSQMSTNAVRELLRTAVPSVDATITSFNPIPARAAYEPIIREAGLTYNIDPSLIRSVIEAESGFDATALSRTGAAGLMQLMPDVAENLGVEDRFNPRENIMGGTKLLRELHDHYKGNLPLVLAGYNAGPKAVSRFRRSVPPFRETQHYVKKVMALFRTSRDPAAD